MEPLVFERDTVDLRLDRGILDLFRRDRSTAAETGLRDTLNKLPG